MSPCSSSFFFSSENALIFFLFFFSLFHPQTFFFFSQTQNHRYLHENGIVHETCQNYQAKNLYKDFKCDAIGICRNCSPKKGCYAMGEPSGVNNFTRYYVDEFGRINTTDYSANAKQMVAEIGSRGPIACAVCVTPEFEKYSGGM